MTTTHQADYAALLLRIALGTMFIAHALLKLLVFTPAGTVGFFASLGVPGWFAYPVMGAELIGGVMLVLGWQTRLVSLALVPVLLGTIVLVHGANGWLYTNANGGWEYSAFLIMASFALSLLGDGAYSVTELLGRKTGHQHRVATVQ
jgi:putative oxidoreductase